MTDQPGHDNGTSTENSPKEKIMGFFDHLEEMRWVLIKSAIALVIAATLVGSFLQKFNRFLLDPLHRFQVKYPDANVNLTTTSIAEPFTIIIQVVIMGGFILAAPFVLYFIGKFISPALTEKESKIALPSLLSATILFFLGASLGFYVLLPNTLEISYLTSKWFDFNFIWTPASYYSFLIWLVLGVGATFEFPIIIIIAITLGILRVATLRKYRRHAIVLILIVAAVITPTPDPITQTIFAAPLYLLFEISILVGARIEKKRALATAETTGNSTETI